MAAPDTNAGGRTSWRTVDIVVSAVLGVAFGVVFAAWNLLWDALSPLFAAFPPGPVVIYGMWLVPAVLGGLVIRKPGAAFLTETMAAAVSLFVFPAVGVMIIVYGALQGLAGEVVFASFRYRRWGPGVALLAGAAAGIVAAALDTVLYNAALAWIWQLTYAVLLVASSTVLAGLGGFFLVRALVPTGVLAPFASGRGRTRD